MNKAERFMDAHKKAKEKLRTSFYFFHPSDHLNFAAEVLLGPDCGSKQVLIRSHFKFSWSPADLDDLAKWAHEMLDDEPE